MTPLLVLAALFALLVYPLGWWTALRFALAGMFLLTASAHWGKKRPDLVGMVPPQFRRPELLVTLTGIAELAGAVGLMVRQTAPWAALGLALLLLAMFPANVYAARQRRTIGGKPVTPLAARTVIQLVFVAATLAVFIPAVR